MTPEPTPEPPVESDERFPSGPWTGFFLQRLRPGRHWMELHLTFRRGVLSGEGRDRIGAFLVRGRYDVESGRCAWSKRYIGKHDVAYQGYNEGKGIWGVWELTDSGRTWRGGFHIWPLAMGDPTGSKRAASVEQPVEEPLAVVG